MINTTAAQTGELIWVVRNDDGVPLYKIEPYNNHLCYNLFEWGPTKKRDTGEEVWGWKDMGKYPTSLEHACTMLRDMLIMETGLETSEFSELKKTVTRSTTRIVKAVKGGFANGEGQSQQTG